MSLLSICQSAADQIGLDRPSQIAASNLQEARRMLALANRAGASIADAHLWTVLVLEEEFVTVASQDTYVLPNDFDRILADTAWDRTNFWRLRGQLTPREWQARKSTLVAQTDIRRAWRITPVFGAKNFTIDPVPASSGETLVYNYITTLWALSSGGSGQTKYLADTDVTRIPEDLVELQLIWRLLQSHGQPYLDQRAEAESELTQAIADDRAADWTTVGRNRALTFVNLPEGGYG